MKSIGKNISLPLEIIAFDIFYVIDGICDIKRINYRKVTLVYFDLLYFNLLLYFAVDCHELPT